MDRREAMTGSLLGALALSTPAVAQTTAVPESANRRGLTAVITIDGQTYTYAQTGGKDLGNYHGPGFTETCIEATPPVGAPAGLVVRFHQDVAPGTHFDVRFRMGAVDPVGDPTGVATTVLATSQSLAGATIQIFMDGVAQAGYFGPNPVAASSFSVPNMFWYQRFRWQNAPRPVLYTSAQLIAARLIPPMGTSDAPGTAVVPGLASTVYAPLGMAGLITYEDATGEAGERGVVTEWQAYYICVEGKDPNALPMMLNTAEASGTIPWAYVDKNTGAPFNLAQYPKVNTSAGPILPSYHSTFQKTGGIAGGIDISDSHFPSLSPVPFMYTGDSYFLENAQFEGFMVFFISTYPTSVLGFPMVNWDQDRCIAWGVRSLLYAGTCTAVAEKNGALPSWLLPSSAFKGLSQNIATWCNRYVNQTTSMGTVFHAGSEVAFIPHFEVSYLTCTVCFLVWMGYTEWAEFANYKLGWHVGLSDGMHGWPASQGGPYYISIGPNSFGQGSSTPDDPAYPAFANWGLAWTKYNTDGNISNANFAAVNAAPNSTASVNIATNGDYLIENRGALAMGAVTGNASVSTALALQNTMVNAYINYVTGKPYMSWRYSFSPAAAGV